MDRQAVAEGLGRAEVELQLAQRGLVEGTLAACVRYRNAVAQMVHLQRLAELLLAA